jgi:pSer/pThr/pTyr-binding forkhead associated (FHA) protein
MQVVLVMFRGGEGEKRSFSIARDVTVIGRREDCDFRIPLGEISRKHCRLVKEDGALHVEDLGSSNGTYHNGTRVQKADLGAGDTLQVGSVAFVVQIDGTPAEEDMQPITAGSRATHAPGAERPERPEAPDATLANNRNGGAGKANGGSTAGSGEFDPMTILAAEGSGALPAIDDSNAHTEDVMIDLAEGSQHGGAAEQINP